MTRDTRSAYRARAASVERTIDEALLSEKNRQEIAYKVAKDMREARELARRKFTRDDLINAVVVKDGYGWHKVLYMNQLTVTVDGDFGARRLPFGRVIDYREATK